MTLSTLPSLILFRTFFSNTKDRTSDKPNFISYTATWTGWATSVYSLYSSDNRSIKQVAVSWETKIVSWETKVVSVRIKRGFPYHVQLGILNNVHAIIYLPVARLVKNLLYLHNFNVTHQIHHFHCSFKKINAFLSQSIEFQRITAENHLTKRTKLGYISNGC